VAWPLSSNLRDRRRDDRGHDRVAATLADGEVRYGIVAGAATRIPWGQAAQATTELSPHAFLEAIPDVGHFIWLEEPGRILAVLRRLSHNLAGALAAS
jgi:pimeloyl-ACP methyl ester carboxylesterase